MIRNYRKLFESEFYLDYDTEYDTGLPDKIEMCGYTWSKIGEIHENLLYLCDNIVRRMPFSKIGNNVWLNSDIRIWLNKDFYKKIPSEYKDRIVKYDDDNLFLLSTDEFERFENNISNIQKWWWLRSQGSISYYATVVNNDGSVDNYGDNVADIYHGVRPALLLW